MDVILQILKIREIGIVKFGEPDFTQLTGLALLLIAIALISISTMKEAQDQRETRNMQQLLSAGQTTSSSFQNEIVSTPGASSSADPEVSSPQAAKKSTRGGRTPSRGRTPKIEAPVEEEEEEERAKTPSKRRATSNRRGRQSEANEAVTSPEVTKTRTRVARTPRA